VYKLHTNGDFMKTNNFNKLIKVALLSAALVTSVVACGNKNKDNQQLNAFQQSCVSNCQDISAIPFFTVNSTAQSQSYGYGYGSQSSMRLSLSFAGQNINPQQSQNQNYNQWASPAMNYSGRVSVVGTATTSQVLSPAFCPQVPAGQYSVVTNAAGQWNQGQISGVRLVFSGPVSMTAILTNAQASEGMYQYGAGGSRLYGTLQIEQVNGYYCQGSNFYLY
jgi:hypothetical protein